VTLLIVTAIMTLTRIERNTPQALSVIKLLAPDHYDIQATREFRDSVVKELDQMTDFLSDINERRLASMRQEDVHKLTQQTIASLKLIEMTLDMINDGISEISAWLGPR
jgi:hypothetical protein